MLGDTLRPTTSHLHSEQTELWNPITPMWYWQSPNGNGNALTTISIDECQIIGFYMYPCHEHVYIFIVFYYICTVHCILLSYKLTSCLVQ